MSTTLPWRQIHLDFHTSEHIEGVGAAFDGDAFGRTLAAAGVDSVTLFARCHHGWSYYPSAVLPAHPHLVRPDLLGEQVAACRAHGIATPIYITVQWDERIAREQPGWRVVEPQGDAAQLQATWHTLCLSNAPYVDLLIAQAEEVIARYRPEGLFFDIVGLRNCVCSNCLHRMQEAGRDPEQGGDRLANHRELILEFTTRVSAAVRAHDPACRIFYNSGHIAKGERDRWPAYSHLELESLPTGGWGYDHFPVSARHAATLGLPYLGMTGKFHTTWGEFGGYKRPVALDYECAAMVAHGARCSIGDQLHPSGAIDAATYASIAPAFRRVAALEPWLDGARNVADIAVLSAESLSREGGSARGSRRQEIDAGIVRVLLETQQLFDVIDAEQDLSPYRLLILPDEVTLDAALAARIETFRAAGGALLLSGSSGMDAECSRFLLDLDVAFDGGQSPWQPDYIVARPGLDQELVDAPAVVYQRAWAVRARCDEQVLAESRAPWFNRHWAHFCSHQHAPPREERNAAYDALIQVDERTIYASHPLGIEYFKTGQPQTKYLLRGAIARLLGAARLRTGLPSAGRATLTSQDGRLNLHLTYAQTQLRGSAHPIWGRERQIEILEDAVPLHGVAIDLALPRPPRRVVVQPAGTELPCDWSDGRARCVLPRLDLHALVVFEE